MDGGKILALNKENFEVEVIKSDKLVMVDFWAQWCGPCRMIGPVIDELSEYYGDKIMIGKVNVDENRDIASRYRIMSIPTIIFFSNGQPVETLIGVRSKEELIKLIDSKLK